MAIIKSYSDLQQSKKLAEILPLESADMCFANDGTAIKIDANPYNVRKHMWKGVQLIPCWSLAALLNVLPAECECMSLEHINYGNNHKKYFMSYVGGEYTDIYDNPIDACYEMIIKLHKLNLL